MCIIEIDCTKCIIDTRSCFYNLVLMIGRYFSCIYAEVALCGIMMLKTDSCCVFQHCAREHYVYQLTTYD